MKTNTYIKDTLTPGEQVQYHAKVHPALYVAMIPAFLLLEAVFAWALLGQGLGERFPISWLLFLCPLLVFAQSWLEINTTELALTNRRVISKTGVISQQTSELQVDQIESVEVKQGLFGRILNYGTVTVKGTGGGAAPAPGIVDPLKFRKAVQELTTSRT